MNEANSEIDVLTHCVMLSYGVLKTEKQQRKNYVMHLLLAKSNSVFSAHLIDTNAKAVSFV